MFGATGFVVNLVPTRAALLKSPINEPPVAEKEREYPKRYH